MKVNDMGGYESFLLKRLDTVQEQMKLYQNSFNPNQYENKNNYMAYYHTLGAEIADTFSRLDYLFVSVSSGGTITGLSLRLKERFKNLKVIAVDVEGSVVFDNKPKPRKIPGMGSGFKTKFFDTALIDDYVIVSEPEIICSCHELLNQHSIFVGGSSGAAYCAINKYFDKSQVRGANVLFISPDYGSTYIDKIYNQRMLQQSMEQVNVSV